MTKLTKLMMAGLFTALICLTTAFIKIPAVQGYIHPGDAFILTGVSLLGPWGILCASIGSGLADLLAGYAIFVPGTVVVKGLMAFIFFLVINKRETKLWRILVGGILAELVMVAGYFAYESLIYDVKTAAAGIPFNLVQAAGGVLIALFLIPIANKALKTMKIGI